MRDARTAVDIAANQVGIARLEIGGLHHVPFENTIAETRREPLDLRFHPLAHVNVGAVRHVAIGPERVLACRSTRAVKDALLRNQHEWSLRMFAPRHATFRSGDFIERPADVHRPCEPAFLRLPRDRFRKGVVDLQTPGASETLESAAIIFRSLPAAKRSMPRGTSSKIARAFGNSAKFSIRRFVPILPPSCARYAASAFVIAWAPPRGIGQPTAWPAIASTSPIAADPMASRGRKEWPARPAKSARAGSS